MEHLIGRLAPSPTGALHLGNARTFMFAWLSMRAQGGQMILRIEDMDSPRVKPWAQQATLDDLRWLGFNWDSGPDVGGDSGPYVQTQRMELYRPWLEKLKELELVYPCDCSRSEIAAAASAPHEATLEGPVYPGTCSQRRVADSTAFRPDQFAWRFRASADALCWSDRYAGPKSCHPARDLGDFIVAKGDGTPAYQLAVIVDDYLMQVTEVVRGVDLIPSTFRQLDLLARFGWSAPSYAHVPLMIGSDGRRLAKRHGDTRISWFRQAGYSPSQLWGYLAWTAGLLFAPQPVELGELLQRWPPRSVNNEPTTVKLDDLLRLLDRL